MRIRRSNPMNAVGRLPTAPRALAFAAVAALVLGGLGVWAERTTVARQVGAVRAALAAQGRPDAVVEPEGGCGRARRLYTWTSGAASGLACAGPGERVELRPARPRDAR